MASQHLVTDKVCTSLFDLLIFTPLSLAAEDLTSALEFPAPTTTGTSQTTTGPAQSTTGAAQTTSESARIVVGISLLLLAVLVSL